jgi:hypothetical protein
MNDVDRWLYLDGPEPDHLRPLFDTLRDLEPATPADRARAARRFAATRAAELRDENSAPEAEVTPPARAGLVRALEAEPLPEAPPLPEAAPPPAFVAPSVLQAPAALTMTTDVAAALKGALPFKPESPDQPRAAKTVQLPAMRSSFGETAPLSADAVHKAVAPTPFPGTGGESKVPYPSLTLKQYVSFRVELALQAGQWRRIYGDYGVPSVTSCDAMIADWQEHFAKNPEAAAEYARDFAAFDKFMRAKLGLPSSS